MKQLLLILFSLVPLSLDAAQMIDGSISGVWYDESHPGHGVILNISDQKNKKVFLATWYTYDQQRNQMWLIGTTPIDGDQSRITVPMNTTRGAMFGVDFDARDVVTEKWGNITFDFTDCDHGVVHYNPVQTGFVDGQFSITRLTNTASLVCVDNEEEQISTQINDTHCDLSGKIVGITDGDTVTLLDSENQQHKIRLAGLDAPELGQPFGQASRRFLKSKVSKKQVCIQGEKVDRYNRRVGKILLDLVDVNLDVVRAGLAWHYKKYQHEQSADDRRRYSQAEDAARLEMIGIWSEPSPIPPWDWRAGIRHSTEDNKPSQPNNQKSCGTKTFCTQMISCSEARFYYRQCGLSRLDGDHDGIPCESLCR